MERVLVRSLTVCSLWFVILAAPTVAQTHASAVLRGRLIDTDGLPVRGAQVTAIHTPTGASATTLTDEQGGFRITALRSGGPYEVRVTAPGFAPLQQSQLHLGVGETLDLDLVIMPGAIALSPVEVVVRAEPVFSPTRTGAVLLVDRHSASAMPSVSRNHLDLVRLSPLVRVSGTSISVAGQNDRFNRLQIDGVLSQDGFGRDVPTLEGVRDLAKPVPLGAIEQFQVLIAPYDVRSSSFTGGLLNTVTRSGTNEWTGSAFAHYRNHHLLGDLHLDGAVIAPDNFTKQVFGFDLGGPLRRDRVHLFVAGEWEQRHNPAPGFSLGAADPVRAGVAPDSARRLSEILRDSYGYDAGDFGRHTFDNPISNAFARLDVELSAAHRLTSWYNYAGAAFDLGPSRDATDVYEFSSSASRFRAASHGGMAQLTSRLGGSLSNELTLGIQRSRDDRTPYSEGPQIDVEVYSTFGDFSLRRRVRAGPSFYGQPSALSQGLVQVTNNLSGRFGNHGLTLGVHVERHLIRSQYLPGGQGAYHFASLAELEVNLPRRYEVHVLEPGMDPAVRFSVWQLGLYLQEEWQARRGLVLHLGLRSDFAVLPARPEENPQLRNALSLSTSEVPQARPVLSPRFGFNWQGERLLRTQLRGGIGIFAGRVPFAWLADAYAGTGLRSRFITCTGTFQGVEFDFVPGSPPLDPLGPTPEECAEGGVSTAAVTLLDTELSMPRDLRWSLALDQQLPYGTSVSVEGMVSHALRQTAVMDANLDVEVSDPRAEDGYGPGLGRRTHVGTPTLTGFRPNRLSDEFGSVLRVTNGEGDYVYSIGAEVRRIAASGLELRAGYAYTRSFDRQNLIGHHASANFGNTPVERHPNDPVLAPSHFDRPHKAVVSAVQPIVWRAGETQLSVLYEGQSGGRYSYVYESDMNGDGQPGGGWATDSYNDLIYVPLQRDELIIGFASSLLLEQLILQDACLRDVRGSILWRNSCRTPWSNRVDVQLGHAVRAAGRQLRLSASILNVMNLMRSDWGQVYRAPATVPVLAVVGRQRQQLAPSPSDPLVVRYTGPVRRDLETGRVVAALPHLVSAPESQWQAQLGIQLAW